MNTEMPRILVVDDEPGMREGCRRILESEGYEVETAEDGVAGIEIFQAREDFAAALVDLKMPRMDGIELIKRISQIDEDVIALVMTAYATIETAVQATKQGAYGYIPKPFTPDEVLIPVKNGLDMRALSIEARQLREERERQLLEVASERSRCRTIINCMSDGVLVVNRSNQIVLRNAAAGRILPHCDSADLPADSSALACPELQTLIEDTLGSGPDPVIHSREIVLAATPYMVNASPILEKHQEATGAVAVLRDITALKELETAKSMFVSMVAHEVKSPLAAIEGYLNVLLSGIAGDNPDQHRKMLERSLLRARALGAMVSELLNLTAMRTGNFVIKRVPLDLVEVVTEATESSREQAHKKQLEFSLSCAPTVAHNHVLADKGAMSMVFKNLIDNAIKYTPAKGHVTVRVDYDKASVNVTVEDDGIGMTPEDQDRAFDEFFRAKNENMAGIPGTGLGLTLVEKLVETHHGRISVQSTPGKGSAFTVSLPMAE